MSGKNQHVVPHDSGWAVKGAGNSKATSIHSTQVEAAAQARSIAQNQGSEMLIHGKNGQIREKIVTVMIRTLPKANDFSHFLCNWRS